VNEKRIERGWKREMKRKRKRKGVADSHDAGREE